MTIRSYYRAYRRLGSTRLTAARHATASRWWDARARGTITLKDWLN